LIDREVVKISPGAPLIDMTVVFYRCSVFDQSIQCHDISCLTLLKSKASIFDTMLFPDGLFGDPLEVTSDWEHDDDDENCKDVDGESPFRVLLDKTKLLLWAERTGSAAPVRTVTAPNSSNDKGLSSAKSLDPVWSMRRSSKLVSGDSSFTGLYLSQSHDSKLLFKELLPKLFELDGLDAEPVDPGGDPVANLRIVVETNILCCNFESKMETNSNLNEKDRKLFRSRSL
jgi:hypothetical protein